MEPNRLTKAFIRERRAIGIAGVQLRDDVTSGPIEWAEQFYIYEPDYEPLDEQNGQP